MIRNVGDDSRSYAPATNVNVCTHQFTLLKHQQNCLVCHFSEPNTCWTLVNTQPDRHFMMDMTH